jgi:HEAT repeat protein
VALGYGKGAEVANALSDALGDSYLVNREAARGLFRVDPARATREILARLKNSENVYARRYAAIVLGRFLDRSVPTRFARTILASGLAVRDPIAGLFLYLEEENLYARWGRK